VYTSFGGNGGNARDVLAWMRQVFNNFERDRVRRIADDRNGSRRLLQLLHHARRKGEDDVGSGSDNLASSVRKPLALTATGESQYDKVTPAGLSLHCNGNIQLGTGGFIWT
jgi:hypothetical protein